MRALAIHKGVAHVNGSGLAVVRRCSVILRVDNPWELIISGTAIRAAGPRPVHGILFGLPPRFSASANRFRTGQTAFNRPTIVTGRILEASLG